MARFLVIDDDPVWRKALRVALAAGGHDVIEARGAREAVVVLRAFLCDVDLVVLDWSMPIRDGGAFLASRALRPDMAAVPVVVLRDGDALAPRDDVAGMLHKADGAPSVARAVQSMIAHRVE